MKLLVTGRTKPPNIKPVLRLIAIVMGTQMLMFLVTPLAALWGNKFTVLNGVHDLRASLDSFWVLLFVSLVISLDALFAIVGSAIPSTIFALFLFRNTFLGKFPFLRLSPPLHTGATSGRLLVLFRARLTSLLMSVWARTIAIELVKRLGLTAGRAGLFIHGLCLRCIAVVAKYIRDTAGWQIGGVLCAL